VSRKNKGPMPVDFAPEILITGKYNGSELSFILTEDSIFNGISSDDLDLLRKCLWDVCEAKIDRKKYLS